jgi:hypothetical protein
MEHNHPCLRQDFRADGVDANCCLRPTALVFSSLREKSCDFTASFLWSAVLTFGPAVLFTLAGRTRG